MWSERTRSAPRLALILLGLAVLGAEIPARGQNLNPRSYWPAPAGTNVFSFGYAYADGGVLVDPSLPVENGKSQSHGLKAGYVRFFGLAGRTASLALEVPRSEAKLTGVVERREAERLLSGWGDSSLRLAVNLKGAPRMTPEQFREFLGHPESIIGASVQVTVPTGQYDVDRAFNLGTNRWSVRPEIGYLSTSGSWVIEASAGIRFFTDNDEFLGTTREQEPIASGQFHVSRLVRRTRPDFWYSLGISYANGGRTTVDGVERNDLLQNAVIGATLAVPLGSGQAIRFGVVTSIRTSIGEKSTSGLIAYSKAWR